MLFAKTTPNMAERKRNRTKKKAPRPILHRRMLPVVLLHVRDGINADQRADNANDQRHDDGKIVDVEPAGDAWHFAEHFAVEYNPGLREDKHRYPPFFRLDVFAQIKQIESERNFHRQSSLVHPRKDGAEIGDARADKPEPAVDGPHRNRQRTGPDDEPPKLRRPRDQCQHCRNKGKRQKEDQNLHRHPHRHSMSISRNRHPFCQPARALNANGSKASQTHELTGYEN